VKGATLRPRFSAVTAESKTPTRTSEFFKNSDVSFIYHPLNHPLWVMPLHSAERYYGHILISRQQPRERSLEMENVLQMWLNPINLGILFLCLTAGIWLLIKSGPNTDK
jgi:hypothetical protein